MIVFVMKKNSVLFFVQRVLLPVNAAAGFILIILRVSLMSDRAVPEL